MHGQFADAASFLKDGLNLIHDRFKAFAHAVDLAVADTHFLGPQHGLIITACPPLRIGRKPGWRLIP